MTCAHAPEGKGVRHVFSVLRTKGMMHVVRSGAFIVRHRTRLYSELLYNRLFKSYRKFVYDGRRYSYLYHKYNTTWRNERAVEIPIALSVLEGYRGRKVLEVGNVLSHYASVSHEVVDKYEKGEGVVNEDIVDFRTDKRYDLVISISTVEHVGWDEDPNDPSKVLGKGSKALDAIAHMAALLAPKGLMVVTFPVGANPALDAAVAEMTVPHSRIKFMRRVSRGNRWVEAEPRECIGARYGTPYTAANALVLLYVSK